MEGSPQSFFCVLFDEAMLRNIKKCTVVEARCISDKINWDVTLDELNKFIGLITASGTLGQRVLPVESLWESAWTLPMFNNTLSRHIFEKIMQFLRFDAKSDKHERVIHDNFSGFFVMEPFLRTGKWGMYLALTLLLTSNYFHVRLDAF